MPEKKDVHASRCTPGGLRCALSLAPLAQHSTMIALVTGGLHFKSSLSEPALLLIRLFQKITSPCVVTLRRTFTAQSDMLAPSITRWPEVGGTPVTSQRGRRALRIHRSHAWIFFLSLTLPRTWMASACPSSCRATPVNSKEWCDWVLSRSFSGVCVSVDVLVLQRDLENDVKRSFDFCWRLLTIFVSSLSVVETPSFACYRVV